MIDENARLFVLGDHDIAENASSSKTSAIDDARMTISTVTPSSAAYSAESAQRRFTFIARASSDYCERPYPTPRTVRMNEPGSPGPVDLCPKVRNVRFDDVRAAFKIVAPDDFEQMVLAEDATRLAHKDFEQIELALRKLERRPCRARLRACRD